MNYKALNSDTSFASQDSLVISPDGTLGYFFLSGTTCTVYNIDSGGLVSKKATYTRTSNHSNMASPGKILSGDTMPLMYVSDWDGDRGCLVYRDTSSGLSLVQKIVPSSALASSSTFGLGYTDYLADPDNNYLYSICYKTAAEYHEISGNETVICKFALPSTDSSTVTLDTSDVLDSFEVEPMGARQDGFIHGGKLYIVNGYNSPNYIKSRIRVVDPTSKSVVETYDISTIKDKEPECLAYNPLTGEVWLRYAENGGTLYSLDIIEEEEDNTKIYYTSTDGNIVTPYSSTAFGATITGNTYESGKGCITFDGDVTSIGNHAFSGCSSLTSITIPLSVVTIDDSAFSGCSSLTSITIPNSVTSICDYAFYNCTSLESITIPSSVTTINSWVFGNCTSLTSVTIPSSVTSIGYSAFYGCKSLKSITIPNSVTEIGEYAFYNCTSLTSITCNATAAPTVQSDTFLRIATDGVLTVPSGSDYSTWMSTSEYYLGYYNWTINYIVDNNKIYYTSTDGNTVTPYKTGVFGATITGNTYESGKGCITFDGDVTSIGSYAFYNCNTLSSITIPSSVISIGDHAFYHSSLTTINIPNSVTSIGGSAFYSCFYLTSITIPSSVTYIGTFFFCACNSLVSINVDTGNTIYDSRDNCNAIIETSTNKLIAGCQSTIIPETTVAIGTGAFEQCKLTSINIPNSVTSIEGSAFNSCTKLTSVTIGSSVTSIDSYAFGQCSSLTSITCNATAAPTVQSDTFIMVATGGTLTVPSGSTNSYSTWMSTSEYYLGYYNWTIKEDSDLTNLRDWEGNKLPFHLLRDYKGNPISSRNNFYDSHGNHLVI